MLPTTGSRIRDLREGKKWSQIELADKLGINNSVLSRIESDDRKLESELLTKIADLFNVDADYLLVRTDQERKGVSHTEPTKQFFKIDKPDNYSDQEFEELKQELQDFYEFVREKRKKRP